MSLEKAIARPDIRLITEALSLRDRAAAKRLLQEWWIGLRREFLPGGECWTLGGYFFLEFQTEVLEAISDSGIDSEQPRLFIGRRAFWSVAAVELFEAEKFEELRRRLPGALRIYNAQAYLIWARLLARDGRKLEAGKYFLFSGLYSNAESEYVERFKRTLDRARPNEIVGRIPRSFISRSARLGFSPKIFEDLNTVPCPEWLKRKPL